MLREDILQLDQSERRFLADAFHEGTSTRRTRGMIASAAVYLICLIIFVVVGFKEWFIAGLIVVFAAASAIEKVAYRRSMEKYQIVIRKLTQRLNSLK